MTIGTLSSFAMIRAPNTWKFNQPQYWYRWVFTTSCSLQCCG